MRVLVISVDVSEMSQAEIDDLRIAMEVQTEDYSCQILTSTARGLEVDCECDGECEDCECCEDNSQH
jgi:hypothetical protein